MKQVKCNGDRLLQISDEHVGMNEVPDRSFWDLDDQVKQHMDC
jgi:hypothetical protein